MSHISRKQLAVILHVMGTMQFIAIKPTTSMTEFTGRRYTVVDEPNIQKKHKNSNNRPYYNRHNRW